MNKLLVYGKYIGPRNFVLQTTWQFFAVLIAWKLYIYILEITLFRCYFLFGIGNVYYKCIARSNCWYLEWIRYKILSLNLSFLQNAVKELIPSSRHYAAIVNNG